MNCTSRLPIRYLLIKTISAIFILLALLLSERGKAASLQAVAINVDPSSGSEGTSVTISGYGFPYVSGAPDAEIRWDGETGVSFNMSPSGTFVEPFAIPAGATPGMHIISVCTSCDSEFDVTASVNFTVLAPSTETPMPATDTPGVPTIMPATPTPTPDIPSVCDDLGLGPDAVVVDFESFSPGQVLDSELDATYGVSFERSVEVTTPSVSTRSGILAAKSTEDPEFGGSNTIPIRLTFSRAVQAIGMFVGLDGSEGGQVTATLQAWSVSMDRSEILLWTSEVTFPAVPTDIIHCLRIDVGGDQYITQAQLHFTNDAGGELFTPKLMDDLTLVYASNGLPEDIAPPLVDIQLPIEGQPFSGPPVRVNANIIEDRDLSEVWYEVNGRGRDMVGFVASVDAPMEYRATFELPPNRLTPYVNNTITIHAVDNTGLDGNDSVTIYYNPPPTATPTPTVDIILDNYEVTQGFQFQCLGDAICGNNSPLYTRKPTLVRLYVRATGTSSDIPNVTGRLCNSWWDHGYWSGSCVAPLNTITVTTVNDPVQAYHDDPSMTLNFLIPPEMLNSGHLDLSVNLPHPYPELNYGEYIPESFYGNNTRQPFLVLTFSSPVYIKFIPIQIRGTWGSLGEMVPILDWLSMTYPTGYFVQQTISGGRGLDVDASFTITTGWGCGTPWDDILDTLWWYGAGENDPYDVTRYYGLVDNAAIRSGEAGGCGKTPGYESAGIVLTGNRNGPETAAQEIGHNFDREHAPGCNADGVDSSYPMPNGLLDSTGIDVRRLQIYDPATSYDFMGYCGGENNTWVSKYTYAALANAFRSEQGFEDSFSRKLASLITQPTNELVLVASGEVTPEMVKVQRGFYILPRSLNIHDSPHEGNYTVELLDNAGTVLASQTFGPVSLSNDLPSESGLFEIVVPWADGTSSLVFKYMGTEIGRRDVSPNAPEVHLLYPNGGENWSAEGEETIRWDASDPDGDKLKYIVQYSTDGGVSWSVMALHSDITSLTVDTSQIAGGNQALVRVWATDGVNTSSDTSDSVFTISNKGPTVFIASPTDGSIFPSWHQAIFRAYAIDREDGELDDTAYVWSSRKDGQLGTGPSVWGIPLSTGKHVITLQVTDSEGVSSTSSVSIVIGSEQKTYPIWLLVILVVVGILILFVFVTRKRKNIKNSTQ